MKSQFLIKINSFVKNRLITSPVTCIEHKFSTIYLGVDSDVYFEIPDIGDYENFDIF